MFFRLLAMILFTAFCSLSPSLRAEDSVGDLASRFVTPPQGTEAPVFVFEDAEGHVLNLRHFHGHYVLLNLWATWCAPCVKEMPSLDALAARAKTAFPSLVVVPLTEDRNAAAAAQGFYTRHAIKNLEIYIDRSGDAPSVLHARSLPTTVLFGPDGLEVGRILGDVSWDAPETLTFLRSKIKDRAPPSL